MRLLCDPIGALDQLPACQRVMLGELFDQLFRRNDLVCIFHWGILYYADIKQISPSFQGRPIWKWFCDGTILLECFQKSLSAVAQAVGYDRGDAEHDLIPVYGMFDRGSA
ncbi:MAG: hypothetical protein MZV70_21650 [Desulfobacterales bacterium]|nr:hypothetical protein [Desulfobacterales bacterium]